MKIYIHMVQVVNPFFFNILLQEHLELSVITILIILFWSVDTYDMLLNLPSK